MIKPTDVDHDVVVASRRRFLREGSALMGGAVLAGGLAGSETLAAADAATAGNVPPNVGVDENAGRSRLGSQLYGTPSPFEKASCATCRKTPRQYLSR
jgi:sulfane dehydrogenase subunit SoxC